MERYEPYSFLLRVGIFTIVAMPQWREGIYSGVVEHAEKRKYIQSDKAQDYIQATEISLKKVGKAEKMKMK